jgi:hypothetical protein
MSNGLAEPWRPNLFMHEVSESTGEANALGFPNDSVICYEATLRRASGFAAIQASGKSSPSRSVGWEGSRSEMSFR